MELDSALQTYISESRELLEEMEDALLRVEHESDKQESLNAIFRAAHTIKGSAGLFGLEEIVSFTHGVESLLDMLREGSVELNAEITALLLVCRDYIGDLIEYYAVEKNEIDDVMRLKGDDLTVRLRDAGAGVNMMPASTELQIEHGQDSLVERIDSGKVASDNWHISLRFGRQSFRDGMDPISFLRYLNKLGEIVSIDTLDDALPNADEMDPESCYLGFEINFKSSADKKSIEDVFEFVRADSLVRILPPRSLLTEYVIHIQELPEEDMRLGEILVSCGSLTKTELAEALQLQNSLKEQNVRQPLGSIVVESGMTTQTVLDAAVEKQSRVRSGKSRESHTVRVDADKLDSHINLIGELVIASAGSALNAQANGDNSLIESISVLGSLVEEVRDSALRLRMVQIGATFNRFQRVVREVASELGKEINLVITGAETEMDKSVIEKIGDPLMHLVRNSIDHGIEPAELREAQGKPVIGTLGLNAFHDSGSIVVEVSDDGAGLDRDRILEKAITKGLAQHGQHYEDQEIYNLIFEPGFSTADAVTNLSGRGVGMDVVKRNITALRGSVEVESMPGAGTTIRIRMPLTLAIIDGFLIGVEKSSFVIPLDLMHECIDLNESDYENNIDREYINLRGEVLPFIRLRELFKIGGRLEQRESVVVVRSGNNKAGLVVDRLMGEYQTVIKPLGKIFSQVSGISGSTILGNGEVALILDVPGLVRKASSCKQDRPVTVA